MRVACTRPFVNTLRFRSARNERLHAARERAVCVWHLSEHVESHWAANSSLTVGYALRVIRMIPLTCNVTHAFENAYTIIARARADGGKGPHSISVAQ